MEAQLVELLAFLHDKNPAVRSIALSNLLGHTPTDSPHRNIFFSGGGGLKKSQENEVIRDLKLLCRDQLTIAHDAFRALVNLSDSPSISASLSDRPFLTFLVSYILNPEAILADLATMLLSNISAFPSACSALLDLKVPAIQDETFLTSYYPPQSRSASCPSPNPYPTGQPRDVEALPLLVDAFVHSVKPASTQSDDSRPRKGDLHFLASVFANISTTQPGRNFFLTPRYADVIHSTGEMEFPLVKIEAFTEHQDTIRRGGVASTIKNCAFHANSHKALLSPESVKVAVPPSTIEAPGIGILPYVLLPLAGPEEFDLEDQERLHPTLQFLPPTKKREPDPALRLIHVETLLLLCTTRWGREFLRDNGVYEIVRAAHVVESVDKISEHIERLVNFLHRDEGPETEADLVLHEEGGDGRVDDLEDEDSRIEEI
ncbi:hypothetical protein JAAARDRAFT_551131 [Jaapia argillacea MUCL 33604]|uniref:Uncharacterized protein n=1 Tax=Jaapia argillacea MUCL 33604 TaxID=933084 RepID=A0A067P763_9AGAM|nr:hypothetical protein JAAARDRAFT_551131 [Jaapia argillacea MUCL 33604]